MTSSPAIETVELTKRFGDVLALDRLTIEVAPGEVFGFLGPNGAGKTTTIRMLLGLARATSGTARIFGFDAWKQPTEAHQHLSFVPGELNAWPTLRGGEILDLLGSLHGEYDTDRRDELCERFEFDQTKKGRDYSKGNRQKIALIAAFMVDPPLLVLDEPTSGLDPLMEITFRHCVNEAKDRGATVFLSSHILSEVEAVCDKVAILRSGVVVEVGTLDALRKLNTREVVVEFGPSALPDLRDVPGIEDLEADAEHSTARFRLRGAPKPMLEALAPADVLSIDIREPSLEELFLTYYGSEVDGGGPRRENGRAGSAVTPASASSSGSGA